MSATKQESKTDNVTTITTKTQQSFKELIVEKHENILLIKFNRPKQRNALNRNAIYELLRVLNLATHDASISVVCLTGVGDIFTAGNDLKQAMAYADVSEFFKSANYILRSLTKAFMVCPKVLVAIVDGGCIGIGFTLCSLCDIVYCTETAYFLAPFTQLGLCPEACATYLFPLILGRSKAAELLLFGAKLTAAQALQFNFVSGVFKNQHELTTELWPKLMEYSKLPGQAMRVTKKLLRKPERDILIKVLKDELTELEKLRYSDTYLQTLENFSNKSNSNKSKL